MKEKISKVMRSLGSGNLGFTIGGLVGALVLSRIVLPEANWLALALVGLMVLAVVLALIRGWGRATAYGLNTVVTVVLVLSIVGVANFLVKSTLGTAKLDLTANKLHTLSDQTEKVVKGLTQDVNAVFFGKFGEKEAARPLLENYSEFSGKFKVEYVDPDKEPTRAKEAGIKKYGSLQLKSGGRTSLVDEVNEEKLTNAIIKLNKSEAQLVCAIQGHGERDLESKDKDGLFAIKQGLEEQSYTVKTVNLPQEGSIPKDCAAIVVVGASRSFFENEIKAMSEFLKGGGSAFIALELTTKGPEAAPELLAMLEKDWGIKSTKALVVDNNPLGRLMGMDASVPLVTEFSKDSPITKDTQIQAALPFTRPVEPKTPITGVNVQWLAKTGPKSWGEVDFSEIASGVLRFKEGADVKGPVTAAVTAEGKHPDGKAAKSSRIVVFGSAQFLTNYYVRFGGNYDLAVNSLSWVMADDSLISIRGKEEGPGKIELSGSAQVTIFWIVVIAIPLAVTGFGIFHWMRRRRL